MVRKVCEEATKNDPGSSGDMWIQALTYFRELPFPNCQTEIVKCLDIIKNAEKDNNDKGKDKREEIISPLVVLEILKTKP
jgi:hypothetical protein